jgi:UDP-N-acetylmuramoyl-L-alanyl-D-glutamate--2,6-diaminopimelate ligase
MGKVAGELADVVILTSDNPRSEDPLAIIEEVATGLEAARPLVDADRGSALARALSIAAAGDVILIAGKGHETGQDFGSHIEPFDDFEATNDVLARLGYRSGSGRS